MEWRNECPSCGRRSTMAFVVQNGRCGSPDCLRRAQERKAVRDLLEESHG